MADECMYLRVSIDEGGKSNPFGENFFANRGIACFLQARNFFYFLFENFAEN